MYIRDVVIQTNANVFPFPNPLFESDPPVPDHFEVGDSLWIGKIEPEAARIILELNEASFHGMMKPTIQFAQLYAYVREIKGPVSPVEWDTDARLQNCVAVSRLLIPTSISLRYAGRILYNTDNGIEVISPANIRGISIDTYLSAKPQRDWLTERDGIRLRGLIAKTDSKPLPPRPSRALWYHEYATRTYYVEVRWTLVATALESLVHVGRSRSTRQFKKRVSQMAKEIGVAHFGLAEAERAYDLRSRLAHGQQLGAFTGPDRELYDLMETVLRCAILRSIEDDEFAETLRDDQKIKRRWPL